jgi:hypothetical protein
VGPLRISLCVILLIPILSSNQKRLTDTTEGTCVPLTRDWTLRVLAPPRFSNVNFVLEDVPSPFKNGGLRWMGSSSMGLFVLFVLSFISTCLAQNLDLSVGVGGPSPAFTFPNVNGFNSLSGKYKHVVILSIDGLHQVYFVVISC